MNKTAKHYSESLSIKRQKPQHETEPQCNSE